jgi:hypothetical protein
MTTIKTKSDFKSQVTTLEQLGMILVAHKMCTIVNLMATNTIEGNTLN